MAVLGRPRDRDGGSEEKAKEFSQLRAEQGHPCTNRNRSRAIKRSMRRASLCGTRREPEFHTAIDMLRVARADEILMPEPVTRTLPAATGRSRLRQGMLSLHGS